MKKIKILYWIFTGLMAAAMIFSSIGNILIWPEAVTLFEQIGQPKFMIPFLGWAKILGVITILIPGLGRIKEWAYAGLTFDLIGATYSFIAIGLPVSDWAPMLVFFLLVGGSYYFHLRLQIKQENEALKVDFAEN